MDGFIAKKQKHTHILSKPPSLSIHKSSHAISKPTTHNNVVTLINKPKIRIIHIFAPEIIKTDAENFRELVQRLTGKPTEKDCPNSKNKKNNKKKSTREDDHDEMIIKPLAKRLDMNRRSDTTTTLGFLGLDHDQRVVKEEEGFHEEEGSEEEAGINYWNHINSNNGNNNNNTNIISGGGGFLDLEGFIEEFNGEYPMLPCLINNPNLDATTSSSSSHMQYGFELGGPQIT